MNKDNLLPLTIIISILAFFLGLSYLEIYKINIRINNLAILKR